MRVALWRAKVTTSGDNYSSPSLANSYDLGIDSLVLGTKETKQSLVKTGGSRSWVTIIDAITAAGRYLDPGIVFKGKELQA